MTKTSMKKEGKIVNIVSSYNEEDQITCKIKPNYSKQTKLIRCIFPPLTSSLYYK